MFPMLVMQRSTGTVHRLSLFGWLHANGQSKLEADVRAIGLRVISLRNVRRHQINFHIEYLENTPSYIARGSRWERVEQKDFDRLRMPASVDHEVHKAATISDATVYAERFREDPFYFVERPRRILGIRLGRHRVCFTYHDAPGFIE